MDECLKQAYQALWYEERAAVKKHADACLKHQATGSSEDRDEVFITLGAVQQAMQTLKMFEAGEG